MAISEALKLLKLIFNVYLFLQFLNVPMFRNVSLKCLTEIAGVSVSQYEEQFVTLFTLTMMQLKQVTSSIFTRMYIKFSDHFVFSLMS